MPIKNWREWYASHGAADQIPIFDIMSLAQIPQGYAGVLRTNAYSLYPNSRTGEWTARS